MTSLISTIKAVKINKFFLYVTPAVTQICYITKTIVKFEIKFGVGMLEDITILYVEDSYVMQASVLEVLKPLVKEVIVANDGQEGFSKYMKYKKYIDLIVSDITMPNLDGLEMIREIRKVSPVIPCILTTTSINPKIFLEAINLHVTHYAIKPFNYDDFVGQIQKAYMIHHQKKLLKKQVVEKEQYLKVIDGVALITRADLRGKITYANDSFCKISGFTQNEIIGKPHNIVRHEDMATSVYDSLWQTIRQGKVWQGIIKNRAKDGSSYYVKSYISPIFDKNSQIREYMGVRLLVTTDEEAKRELKKNMIKNISLQKMTNATIKKENDMLKQTIEQLQNEIEDNTYLKRTIVELKKEQEILKQNFMEELEKSKTKKVVSDIMEERYKNLEVRHNKVLKLIKSNNLNMDMHQLDQLLK
jgi:PAS domain S-box-containing protein